MGKLLRKIWKWVNKLWRSLDKEIEELIPLATKFVQGFKKAVESHQVGYALEIVKFIIPGDWDDKIIDKVMKLGKEYVPKVALQLGIIDSVLGIVDENEQMIAVVEVLKGANDDLKSDYWHELAQQILKALSDGKLTLGEAGALVEYHYKNYIQK